MAIVFTGGTGAFANLGKALGGFNNLKGLLGVNGPNTPGDTWGASGPVIKCLTSTVADIQTAYQSTQPDTLAGQVAGLNTPLYALPAQMQNGLSASMNFLANFAKAALQRVVQLDNPQVRSQLGVCLQEWIRQMQAQSVTVKRCVVSASSAAGSGNTGTPTIVTSVLDSNGLPLEYSYAEALTLKCTKDAQDGATAGNETVSITGQPVYGSPASPSFDRRWPGGSGISTSTQVVDPTQSNAGGNVLSNSSFKTWVGPVATGWTITGSGIQDGGANQYAGAAHCLEWVGAGAGTPYITQNFANGGVTGGTSYTLLPACVYLFNGYYKLSAGSPAAGVLTVSLVDSNNVVINNNAGVPCTITVTLTADADTNWHAVSGAFQTPTNLPAKCAIRFEMTTDLSAGKNLFMDYLALTQAGNGSFSVGPSSNSNYGSSYYPGGPFIEVFRGAVDLLDYESPTIGDLWTVTVANNYAGIIQTLFNQIMGMAGLGMILPSASSPSISDSVVD